MRILTRKALQEIVTEAFLRGQQVGRGERPAALHVERRLG